MVPSTEAVQQQHSNEAVVGTTTTAVTRAVWPWSEETSEPVVVLKTETEVPLQTRRRFPSFEKAGAEET